MTLKKHLLIAFISFFPLVSTSAEEGQVTLTETVYQHDGKAYPPVFFVTNIDDKDFKEKLIAYEAFSKLDSDAVGLPIGVRVLKGHRTKQDGTQFSTLMLSASTLGIVPVVSNTEFLVYYDVFVQGDSIAQFKYQVDSKDVSNMWTMDHGEREVKPAEEMFMEQTMNQFLVDLKTSEVVQNVFEEYWEYFEQ